MSKYRGLFDTNITIYAIIFALLIINYNQKTETKNTKNYTTCLVYGSNHLVFAQGHEYKNAQEKSSIEKLVLSFPESFKAADISKVLILFTLDAIVMANNAVKATGENMPVNNRELFLLHKDNGCMENTPLHG